MLDAFALAPLFAARPLVAVLVLLAAGVLRCWWMGDECPDDVVVRALLFIPCLFLEQAIHEGIKRFVKAVGDAADDLYRRAYAILSTVVAVVAVGVWLYSRVAPVVGSGEQEGASMSPGAFIAALVTTAIVAAISSYARQAVGRAFYLFADGAHTYSRPAALLESMGTVVGVVLAIVAPIVAALFGVAIIVAAVCAAFALRAAARARLERCARCNGDVDACALACPRCNEAHNACAIGVLGTARRSVVVNVNDAAAVKAHRIDLVLRGRCASCASRPGAAPGATCAACNHACDELTRDDVAAAASSSARIALVAAFAAALVPVIGLPLAFVVVRWSRAAGLRRYLPLRARLVGGVLPFVGAVAGAVVAAVLLFFVQPIPLLGPIIVVVALGVGLAWDRRRFLSATTAAPSTPTEPVAITPA